MSTTSQFFGQSGKPNVVRYYDNATFTVPAGVTEVWVKVVGGGGGGGGGIASHYGGSGGGGGMGMKLVTVAPAAAKTITVGAAGAGGGAGGGSTGGTSSFDTDITATGGVGGLANSGAGGGLGAGGSATLADFEIDGSSGESGSGTTAVQGGQSGDFEAGRWTVIDPSSTGTTTSTSIGNTQVALVYAFSWGHGGRSGSGEISLGKFPGGGGATAGATGIAGAQGYVEVRW